MSHATAGPQKFLGITYRGEVTAGHLLTALPLVMGLVVWGVSLESRVDTESEIRRRIEIQMASDRAAVYQRIDLEQGRDRLAQEEIKTLLRELKTEFREQFRAIADKVDRKADR